MLTKEIIILTKSKKYHNYCVAGIDRYTGEWVRIVTDDPKIHGAATAEDLEFADGTICQPLDIVIVPYIGAAPQQYQPENLLMDRNYRLKKIETATLREVLARHPAENKAHKYIFGSKYAYSTGQYFQDRFDSFHQSLTLIECSNLEFYSKLRKFPDGSATKGKMKLKFDCYGPYDPVHYEDMSVTDLNYIDVEEGTFIDRAYIVASTGVPYIPDGKTEPLYYTYIAQIFPV